MLGGTRWGTLAHSWRIAAARAIAPRSTQIIPLDSLSPFPSTRERPKHGLDTDISNRGDRTVFAGALDPQPSGACRDVISFKIDHGLSQGNKLPIGRDFYHINPSHTALTEAWIQCFALGEFGPAIRGGNVLCRTDHPVAQSILSGNWRRFYKGVAARHKIPLEVARAIRLRVLELASIYDLELEYRRIPREENGVADRLAQCWTPALRTKLLDSAMRDQLRASDKRIQALGLAGLEAIGDSVEMSPQTLAGRLASWPIFSPFLALLRHLAKGSHPEDISLRTPVTQLIAVDIAPTPLAPQAATRKTPVPAAPSSPQHRIASRQPGGGRNARKRSNLTASHKAVKAKSKPSPASPPAKPPSLTRSPLPSVVAKHEHSKRSDSSPTTASDPSTTSHPTSSGIPAHLPRTESDRTRYQIKVYAFPGDPHWSFGCALFLTSTQSLVGALNFKLNPASPPPKLDCLHLKSPIDTGSLIVYVGLYALNFWKHLVRGNHVLCSFASPNAVMIVSGTLKVTGRRNGAKKRAERAARKAVLRDAFRDIARVYDMSLEHGVISKSENKLARKIGQFHLPGGREMLASNVEIVEMVEASDRRLREEKWVGYAGICEEGDLGNADLIPLGHLSAESPDLQPALGIVADVPSLPLAGHPKALSEPTNVLPANAELSDTSTIPAVVPIDPSSHPHTHLPARLSTETHRPRYQIKLSAFPTDSHLYIGAVLLTSTKGPVRALTYKVARAAAPPPIEFMHLAEPIDDVALTAYGGLCILSFWKHDLKGSRVKYSWQSRPVVMIARGLDAQGQPTARSAVQGHRVALGDAFRHVAQEYDINLKFAVIPRGENGLARQITRYHLHGGVEGAKISEVRGMIEASDRRLREEKWAGYAGNSATGDLADADLTGLARTATESAEPPSAPIQEAEVSTFAQAEVTESPPEHATGSGSVVTPHLSRTDANEELAPSPTLVTDPTPCNEAVTLSDLAPFTPSDTPTPNPHPIPPQPPSDTISPQFTSKPGPEGYVIRVNISTHRTSTTLSAVLQIAGEAMAVDVVIFEVDHSDALRIGSKSFPIPASDTDSMSAFATLLALHYWRALLRGRGVICCNSNIMAVRLCGSEWTSSAIEAQPLRASIARTIADIARDCDITIEHKYVLRIDNRVAIALSRLGGYRAHPWLDPAIEAMLERSKQRIMEMGIKGDVATAKERASPNLPAIKIALGSRSSKNSIAVNQCRPPRDPTSPHHAQPNTSQLDIAKIITTPTPSSSPAAQADLSP